MKHHNAEAAGEPDTNGPNDPSGVDVADDFNQFDPDAARLRIVTTAREALEAHSARAASYDQLMVQAFVELMTGARAVDRRIPEICVHIDHQTLTGRLHANSLCETADGVPLPPETIRRMCCDGGILPAVMGGDSEIMNLGRSRRLASPAQRTALRSMHSTCVIPGCTATWDRLEVHHVDEWTGQVGDTNLDRLVPICPHDHHRIHEGGWKLALDRDPARTITLTRPDGTTAYHGPSINRQPRRNVA